MTSYPRPVIPGTVWPVMPPMSSPDTYGWLPMSELRLHPRGPVTETLMDPAIVFQVSKENAPGSGSILAWGRDLTVSHHPHTPYPVLTMKHNKTWRAASFSTFEDALASHETRTISMHPSARIAVLVCILPDHKADPWFCRLVDHPDPVALVTFHFGSPKL